MNQFKAVMLIVMMSIASLSASAQHPVSASTIKELEEAETKMFNGILHHNGDYYKNYVASDYITINADGIMADKEQTFADSARSQFLSQFLVKLFDKKIRVYGDVGIITGRAQAFMKETLAGEFLYTAIFVRDHNK